MSMRLLALSISAATYASAQLALVPVDAPMIDIYSTGQWVPGSMANDSEQMLPAADLTAAGFLGNALLPGGVDVLIGANGAVLLNAAANNGFADQIGGSNDDLLTMPPRNTTLGGNGNGLRQLIAPFWDDLSPFLAASIKWQVIDGMLIVTISPMPSPAAGRLSRRTPSHFWRSRATWMATATLILAIWRFCCPTSALPAARRTLTATSTPMAP